MAGTGRIGGGGSCWLNFTVNHGSDGKEKWTAYDEHAGGGKPTIITFQFPDGTEKVVKLEQGKVVRIEWN